MGIEVGLVGLQEVINGYHSCLLVPKGLYWASTCSQVFAYITSSPYLLIIVLEKDIVLNYNTL